MWRIRIKSKDKKNLIKFAFDEHLDISCGGPVLLEWYFGNRRLRRGRKKELTA